MADDTPLGISFTAQAGEDVVKAIDRVGASLDQLGKKAMVAETGLNRLTSAFDRSGQSAVSQASRVVQSHSLTQRAVTAATQAQSAYTAALGATASSAATAGASLSKKTAAVQQTASAAQSAQAATTSLSSSFSSMGKQIAAVTGITLGFAVLREQITDTIATKMQFDRAMSGVAAVGGITQTSAQYRELQKVVMETQSAFTSTETAKGFRELIAAGMTATQSTAALSDTINLAVAGEMDMARASEVMVAALNGFGLAAAQSARVADVLARAANASPAGVNDLGESLKYVAPVAAAVKSPIEDVAAALTLLANNGIRGGNAGRGLASVLAKMVAPSIDARQELDRLGVKADSINPSIVGLEQAIQRLTRIDQQALVKLFGVENLDIANVMRTNAQNFAGLQRQMSDTTITASQFAKTMSDDLTGDMAAAKKAIDSVKLAIGEIYTPALRSAAQEFTTYVKENKDEIAKNVEQVVSLTIVLAKIAAVYGTFRGLAFVVTLARQTAGWIAEKVAIDANTAAIMRNGAARGSLQGAWMQHMGVPRGIANHLSQPVSQAFAFAGKGAAMSFGARLLAGLKVLGPAVIAAVAGWNIGKALDDMFDVSDRLARMATEDFDKVNEASNMSLQLAKETVNAVTDQASALAAKEKIQKEILKWDRIARKESGEERDLANSTIAILTQQMASADKMVGVKLKELQAQKALANAAYEQARAEDIRLNKAEEAARVAFANRERMKKTQAAQVELFKRTNKADDPEGRMKTFDRQETRITQLADYYRRRFTWAANQAGVKIVNGDQEIKTVDDVVAFIRNSAAALNGSTNTALTGNASLASLTELAAQSQTIVEGRTKAQDEIDKRDRREMERIVQKRDLLGEIAVLEMRNAGNEEGANALQREVNILKEKDKLMKDLQLGEKEAANLATRKVLAEEAAKKQKKNERVDVTASSLQEIGGGGTFFGAPVDQQARQTDLLSQIRNTLREILSKSGSGGGGLTLESL